MKLDRSSLLWVIGAWLVGILFGTGGFWQYNQSVLEKKRFELERIVNTIEIRKRMDEVYISILQLSGEYINVSRRYYETNDSNMQNERVRLNARLEVLKNDYVSIENELSLLEGRMPREIRLQFIPPVAPFNPRIY